ncbi:hypothetical protein JCM11251_001719 [Rhodosporidiobolus azoricus]
MPPKQKQGKSDKVKDDKTFGLKNKNKSAKVQQQVKILQQQAAQKGVNAEAKEKQKEKERLAEKKRQEQAKKDELHSLYNPLDIVQPKVPFGVDPKTVLCAFHKAGRCQKGNKCKFSHDLNQERKAEKASIYADQRDDKKPGAPGEDDDMTNWSEEKLREVVSRKGNPKATTDIVCKFFINAIEEGKYGWFWECPNGGAACMYRHALPPGFVLNSQKKKDAEDAKKREISLEDFLEVERHKLDQTKLTPLTKESFAEWKKNRLSKKEAEHQAIQSAKSVTAAAGKSTGMSGRDLFTFNPDMVAGDSDEEEEDEDWDLMMLRAKTENERREREAERIRLLDQFGELSVQDPPPA